MWAVLELKGRRFMAGYISEAKVCGQEFIRIDAAPGDQSTSRFVSASLVCVISAARESDARRMAARRRQTQESPPKPGGIPVCCGCGRTKEEINRAGHIPRKQLIQLLGQSPLVDCQECAVCRDVGRLFLGRDGLMRCEQCNLPLCEKCGGKGCVVCNPKGTYFR